MENINFTPQNKVESVKSEDLIFGKHYTIAAPYTRGQYEGQTFEGEVEFLGTAPDANGAPMYRFLYIKYPDHFQEVTGGSTYQTNEEGLQWIKELN